MPSVKIRALYDVVFIEPLTVSPDAGTLTMPDAYKNSRHYGKLLAIGFHRLKDGSKISCLVGAAPGDTVFYSRAGMWELVVNGKNIVCGKPGYVQAIVEGKIEARLEDHSMRTFV
jgi:hypothetical protein